jgi:putative ABC transport system permease protein
VNRGGWRLWLRWSWRDLRQRWLVVAATALVIALGTGAYAGLSSNTEWRKQSADASFEAARFHDARIRLAEGATVERGTLLAAASGPGGVAAAEERLILPTQVDASRDGETILVPGVVMGVEDPAGRDVSALHVYRGVLPATPGDVLIERNFAFQYDLPDSGMLRLSGGHEVHYTGQALAPEYFVVTDERGGLLAAANFAVVFAELETAGKLTGAPGRVNELVVRFAAGVPVAEGIARLEAALRAALGETGFTTTPGTEEPAYRLIYDDIRGDQQFYNVFAVLILGGAAAAAFNLVTRIVDSQRREIGVAMAIGVPRWRIAARPLLVGGQIALLGVVFGLIVGFGLGQALASVVERFFPLPVWETGFVVLRAVRMPPVAALEPGYRAARGGGAARFLRWLPVPGSTLTLMPFRNLARSPRRSFLTAFAVAAAIAVLVAFAGMVDSFHATIDNGERQVTRMTPDRVDVDLATFTPVDSPPLAAVAGLPGVAAAEPLLRLNGLARRPGHDDVGLIIEVFDLQNPVWAPDITRRAAGTLPGIYLARLAASDLGLDVDDTFTIRHPQVTGPGRVRLVESEVRLAGIHPGSFRFAAYMDADAAALFGLAGFANGLMVAPAAGTDVDDLRRALFATEGVASAQPARAIVDTFRDLLGQVIDVLRIVEGAVLVLALLIAFNSASISTDERARENATMFAFGVPVWRVVGIAIVESLVIGVVATILGLSFGWLIIQWMVTFLLPDTIPDLEILVTISPVTMGIAGALGIVAVGAAPLLTWRRLARQDIPATLKVMA